MRITTKDVGGVALIDVVYAHDITGRVLTINGLSAPDDSTYTYDGLIRHSTATNAGDALLSKTTLPIA